ncbi:uncharacterized protein LOC126285189 [Schistocerca gregaria]|uniref:uncharacterized protein LOC126285189 n=1 Tax=Schistocerca gregaria TaxID=7010 RepID=UPI00211F352F|nr:uncharacterized protein LOC126285189 [Schistocerca gregaria]
MAKRLPRGDAAVVAGSGQRPSAEGATPHASSRLQTARVNKHAAALTPRHGRVPPRQVFLDIPRGAAAGPSFVARTRGRPPAIEGAGYCRRVCAAVAVAAAAAAQEKPDDEEEAGGCSSGITAAAPEQTRSWPRAAAAAAAHERRCDRPADPPTAPWLSLSALSALRTRRESDQEAALGGHRLPLESAAAPGASGPALARSGRRHGTGVGGRPGFLCERRGRALSASASPSARGLFVGERPRLARSEERACAPTAIFVHRN